MDSYSDTNDFYVTVFSNTSSDLFDNTLSKFQVKLPKPIKFDPSEKYVVAVVDICHSPILGYGPSEDNITFKKGKYYVENLEETLSLSFEIAKQMEKVERKFNEDKELLSLPEELFAKKEFKEFIREKQNVVFIPETYLEKIGTTLWSSSKQPFLYTRHYFTEFLNPNNLENLENGVLSKYKTSIPWNAVREGTATIFLVPPLEIQQKFKAKETETPESLLKQDQTKTLRDKVKNSKYIVFQYEREYTAHQVLYRILVKFKQLFERYKTDKTVFDFFKLPFKISEKNTTTDVLFFVATYLVDTYDEQYIKYKEVASNIDFNYVMLYSDLVQPRCVGGLFTNILYLATTRYNNKPGLIEVKNMQYLPVNKNYIETLSFKLCNEYGEQLFLEPGYLPTGITLHFKKVDK